MRHTILIAIIAATVMTGCGTKDAPTAKKAVATVQPKVAVATPAQSPVDAAPMPEADIPERVTRLMATPLGNANAPGPSIKINTTTPDLFVQSLQSIEREATKEKVDMLRGALTVLQFQTQQKIMQIAKGQPNTPQFTDQELMQIAFGEINGMTADQVIAHARKVAPNVVPSQ